jgi:hypothetical protein
MYNLDAISTVGVKHVLTQILLGCSSGFVVSVRVKLGCLRMGLFSLAVDPTWSFLNDFSGEVVYDSLFDVTLPNFSLNFNNDCS